MIKRSMFALMALCLVVTSCNNDDDNNNTITPDAGVLTGGPFTFCVDGMVDNVSGIATDPDAVGTNRTFVITDDAGTILGLPPDLTALQGVDFDGAGAGVCLIWYLRFEDGLVGAEAKPLNITSSSKALSEVSVTKISAC